MKKITFRILLSFTFLLSAIGNAQCLTASHGLYPTTTNTALTCNGIATTTITAAAYCGEYSNVNVTAGETYTFKSSVATDYITISSDNGVSAAAYGITPVTWVAVNSGVVRFYTHLNAACGEASVSRTRSYVCGVPPCIQPIVTFAKVPDCANSTFDVTADITDLGSASTMTVTDNQGSPSQSVSSTGLVTFGPYAFGTSVILTATNDQTAVCNAVSTAQTLAACPPVNDECTNAITLSCGDILTSQSTEGATGGTATSCIGTIGNDIWYTFFGDGQIFTLKATASVESPQIEVYKSTDGTCAGFAPGTCFASAGTGETAPTVSFSSENGVTYYVHIGNYINGNPAVVFDLSLTCEAPATAPDNDDCSGAIALTVNPDAGCGSVTSATLVGATASAVDTAACGGTEDDDVWFSFVAENTTHMINLNNVAGSTTDLYHSLWTGDCGSLTLVPGTCSDPNNSTPTGLVIGQTYYLRVYSYTATPLQTTTFDVCIGTPPPAPDNDECSGAIALTVNPDASCGSVTSGTIQSATASAVDTAACGGTEDDDVWFSFVAENTIHTINLNNVAGSTTDLYHSLWTGDCGSLTLVPGTCSDPNNSTPTGLVVGQTYYLRVYSYTATAGQTTTFDVCIGTPPPPPANDDCSGAIEITAGGTFASNAIIGNNTSATTTTGLTYGCQTNRFNDVWYSVVVPASGSLTIETDTTPGTLMTDSVMSVFSGTCGSLTEIGCDDDAGNGNFSKSVLTGLTPGDTIYIGVWRYGTGNDGAFQLSAYDASLLGTAAFEAASFKAYPNPVNDVLNLSYSKNISKVSVFNLLGQEVLTKAMNSNQSKIDMSHLPSGTYMVKITADDEVKTLKVIKQ